MPTRSCPLHEISLHDLQRLHRFALPATYLHPPELYLTRDGRCANPALEADRCETSFKRLRQSLAGLAWLLESASLLRISFKSSCADRSTSCILLPVSVFAALVR